MNRTRRVLTSSLSITVPAIKNKPVRNEDPKDAKLREYQAEIERLRALIERRHAAERRKKPPRVRAKHERESLSTLMTIKYNYRHGNETKIFRHKVH